MKLKQKIGIVFKDYANAGQLSWAIFGYVLNIVSIWINARILIWISESAADLEHIQFNIIRLVIACILQIGLTTVSKAIRHRTYDKCYTVTMDNYVQKVSNAEVKFYVQTSAAEIQTVGETMAPRLHSLQTLLNMVNNLVSVGVTMYSIWVLAKWMIIPIIILYSIGAIIIKLLFNKFEKLSKEAHDVRHERAQHLENIVNGFIESRIFNQRQRQLNIVKKLNHQALTIFGKRVGIESAINIAIETIDSIGLITMLIYGTYQISLGLMDAATVVALVMFIFRIIDPLAGFLDGMDLLTEGLSSVERYAKIMRWVDEPHNRTLKMATFESSINIDDVSFAYDDSQSAIEQINMKILKGKKIGICGESGGGKSTLFKLLNRFYSANSGKITIDGFDIQDIDDGSFSHLVGAVPQETVIFPGTIKDNIMFSRPDASEYDIIEAAKKARLYDFIQNLPERFNTEVGNKGLKLSGGQKQRIALARVFLQDPEIILMDEATSALDNESEYLIQEAINDMKGKTVIMIAHRLSTLEKCDVIYVIDHKRIAESGSHRGLLKNKGVYYKMHNCNQMDDNDTSIKTVDLNSYPKPEIQCSFSNN